MEKQQNDEDIKIIVDKVQKGEKQEYTAIIEQFQRPIFLYCYYTLHNPQEAEDTTQETFLKAYKHINQFIPNHSFSSWLYKIAQNCCFDLLKKRKKDLKLVSLYQDQQIQQGEYPQIDFIHDCLEKLTKEERQILLLRSLEEYSYNEIAFILNVKSATIRKKYERIKKKLIQYKGQGVNIYEHSY